MKSILSAVNTRLEVAASDSPVKQLADHDLYITTVDFLDDTDSTTKPNIVKACKAQLRELGVKVDVTVRCLDIIGPGGGNPEMLFIVQGKQNMFNVLKLWLADESDGYEDTKYFMSRSVKKLR